MDRFFSIPHPHPLRNSNSRSVIHKEAGSYCTATLRYNCNCTWRSCLLLGMPHTTAFRNLNIVQGKRHAVCSYASSPTRRYCETLISLGCSHVQLCIESHKTILWDPHITRLSTCAVMHCVPQDDTVRPSYHSAVHMCSYVSSPTRRYCETLKSFGSPHVQLCIESHKTILWDPQIIRLYTCAVMHRVPQDDTVRPSYHSVVHMCSYASCPTRRYCETLISLGCPHVQLCIESHKMMLWELKSRCFPPAFTRLYCLAYSALRMEAICSSETSIEFQRIKSLLCSRSCNRENVKSRIIMTVIHLWLHYAEETWQPVSARVVDLLVPPYSVSQLRELNRETKHGFSVGSWRHVNVSSVFLCQLLAVASGCQSSSNSTQE
jgi:hypothetical protein